jgi:hypothetical protein
VLIMDHLSPHLAREPQTALIAWPDVQLLCMPAYACWLHLSEPWWKPLRSLAPKGRRCERLAEVIEAMIQATVSWHAPHYPYVWKKAA